MNFFYPLILIFCVFSVPVIDYPAQGTIPEPKPQFMELYDLSNVPKVPVAAPPNSFGDVVCNSQMADVCSWSCSQCHRSVDITSCENNHHWAITFDDVIELD